MRFEAWTSVALLAFAIPLTIADAQDAPKPPLPDWEDGKPAPEGGPVFLGDHGHTVIVRLEGAPGRSATIIRVPLYNQVEPTLEEYIARSGSIRYSFSVGNGRNAKDEIGEWALLLPQEPIQFTVESPSRPQGSWGGAGGSGSPVPVDQAALNRIAKGRYLQWFPSEQSAVIKPGETVSGFAVESSALPGFTTAWFGSGRLVEFDQSWPEAVFKQLEKLEDRRWRDAFLPAIGPMFVETTPADAIAQNYLAGIEAWIANGRLSADSPFVVRAKALLTDISAAHDVDRLITAVPSTPTERLLGQAMQASIRVRTAPLP